MEGRSSSRRRRGRAGLWRLQGRVSWLSRTDGAGWTAGRGSHVVELVQLVQLVEILAAVETSEVVGRVPWTKNRHRIVSAHEEDEKSRVCIEGGLGGVDIVGIARHWCRHRQTGRGRNAKDSLALSRIAHRGSRGSIDTVHVVQSGCRVQSWWSGGLCGGSTEYTR